MDARQTTQTLEATGRAARLRRWAGRPAFLIAALVLGLGLMFGAPLLLTGFHAAPASPDSAAVSPGAAGAPAARAMDEQAVGTEDGSGSSVSGSKQGAGVSEESGHPEEEGPEPPTLVLIVARVIERGHRGSHPAELHEGLSPPLSPYPHEPEDFTSPAARLLVTFQAPIYSLIVIIILTSLFVAATRKLEMIPGPLQNLVEIAVEWVDGFVKGILGPQGARFVPFLGTLFLYIYFQNIFGLIPLMYTPTSVLDTTLAMAICVFLYVQWVGITSNGIVGYLKHLAGDPQDVIGWSLAPLMLPLHVVGELAKPVSLSLRLFGNMMGEETLLAIFMGLGVSILAFTHTPVGIPLHVPFIFLALITTLVQALVFFLLSTIYFALVLPHEEHGHEEAEHTGGLRHQVGGH